MTADRDILLAQAALDGELDAAGMLAFEQRLAEDPSLAADYNRIQTLRDVMRRELVKPAAPQALRARIFEMAKPAEAPRPSRAAPPWRAMAASAILAAGLGGVSTWVALRASLQESNLTSALIADHKRGLLSGQPFDIASSDRHTVEPWFATRFALSPKVFDLSPQGFPLAGGRIDVIGGAPTPVLIYRHNAHIISLTALPAQAGPARASLVIEGYSVQVWRDGDSDYWAVSDIDPAELAKFRQAFEASAKAAAEKSG